ncbi:MAG: hypothetical protein JW715_09020 [Sedimentisphaerales bacterium]|nr:hypothetical protein [Sedimentisphaerales bacterium]
MKTVIMVLVIAFVVVFIAGCGPGQPFEIEGRHTPQSATPIFSVAE